MPPPSPRHFVAGKFHRNVAIGLAMVMTFQAMQHVWLADNHVELSGGLKTFEVAEASHGSIWQREGDDSEGNHRGGLLSDGALREAEKVPREVGPATQGGGQGHTRISTRSSSDDPAARQTGGPEFLDTKLCDETEWCITSRTRRDIALDTSEFDALCLEPGADVPPPIPTRSGVSPSAVTHLGSRPFLDWRDLILKANTSTRHYPQRPFSAPHCAEIQPATIVYGWNESMAMIRARIRSAYPPICLTLPHFCLSYPFFPPSMSTPRPSLLSSPISLLPLCLSSSSAAAARHAQPSFLQLPPPSSLPSSYQHRRTHPRCGCPFSVIRFGDGELAILRNESYVCPEFRIDKDHPNASSLSRSIMDAIFLSSDPDLQTQHKVLVGLPFFFCREGMTESKRTRRAYRFGGGGRASLVKGYLEMLADSNGRSMAALTQGLVYSWQW